jgi:hypothetical protein
MSEGWYVTAQDIKYWTSTDSRRAQDTLPLLVRKLILASVNPSSLSVPARDSVSVGGWDGVLTVPEGNVFVPTGDSVWEFGTNQRVKGKADDDYQKRTKDPRGINKRKATFVFATTRTWRDRDRWVQDKNAEGEWAQVKGLNSDDLETWLEQCPAVHRWFARLIGKRSDGDWDVEHAWGRWSCATQPPCNADLVIAGRQDRANELANQLRAEPSVIRVFGESGEEAYAFILAVVKKYEEFSSRLLVVREPNDWDILLDSQQALILVPQFDNPPSLGLAVQSGHWVIQPASSSQSAGRQGGIVLGRADRDQQIRALVAMGLEEDTAKYILRSCRGYLQPIRRHHKLTVDYERPDWATPDHAIPLLAALLAGAWTADNTNDCDKLAQLADMSYDDLEQQFHSWAITGDPPVRHVGNVWQIVSRQDAWSLLSQFINASILKRFGEIVKEVLQEIDPRFELPPEERWLANVHRKVTKYSGLLRHGLAEMLAMLATYGDRDCQSVGTSPVQDQVSWWVKQLLLEDISGQRWGSLAEDLPLLAEAAPEIFLEAVETGLQSENPPVMELFIEEGDMGGCPHAGLLWALEDISWNLDHLARVARILAKLARQDSGGSYSNRPSNTLREIFQGWLPQTKAPLDQRLTIIDTLIGFEHESGWQLLLDLLPERVGSTSTPIHRPEFREWAEGWKHGVTKGEYYQHIVAIAKRCLRYADEDPDTRWHEFIKELPQLPRESFDAAIAKLRAKNAGDFSDEAAIKLCSQLREIVCHHREFADAEWALPKEVVDQLGEVLQRFVPDDLVTRHQFLFDTYLPNLTDPAPSRDFKKSQELIEQARSNALEEIWRAQQASGIKRLSESVKFPSSLGICIGNSSFVNEIEEMVLSWLGNDNNSLDQTARAYIGVRYVQNPDWLETIRGQFGGHWHDDMWACFCSGLPFKKAAFDFLETLPEGVRHHYWQNIEAYYLQKEEQECANWVIEQLLAHNRPFAAINAAALHITARKTGLNGNLLARILEHAATDPADHEMTSINYSRNITDVLKALQCNADIDETRLARIEWVYVPIFRYNDIRPAALFKEIAKNPCFFVHLICLAFKADPPIEGEFTDISPESRKIRADNARHLLKLIDQLPGQIDTQSVDAAQLKEWIERVREECVKQNRSGIGDYCIGELLSHSPTGNDGVWPHEVVRDVLEWCESRDIEAGIEDGLYNQRGVTIRYMDEGGTQERELAAKYQQQVDEIKYTWPRTSAMLGRMAESYKRGADRIEKTFEVEMEGYH